MVPVSVWTGTAGVEGEAGAESAMEAVEGVVDFEPCAEDAGVGADAVRASEA